MIVEDVKPKRRLWLRRIAFDLAACGILFAVFMIAANWLLHRAIEGITNNGKALSQVVAEAVELTLEQGTPDHKIDLLNQLAAIGPTANQFTEAVRKCTEDDDPRVQAAARRGLAAIAPGPPPMP